MIGGQASALRQLEFLRAVRLRLARFHARGGGERLETVQRKDPVERDVLAAEDTLPEFPASQKIAVLPGLEPILTRPREIADIVAHRLGISQVLQPMAGGVPDEIHQIHRIVELRQIVVKNGFSASFEHILHLFADGGAAGVVGGKRGHQTRQLVRLFDADPRRSRAPGVEFQKIPHVAPEVASRQSVVADISDAAWGKRRGADLEQPVADLARHPRIEAVGNDIIELAIGLPAEQIGLEQLQVGEAEFRGRVAPPRQGNGGPVHAGELALRVFESQRQQVARVAAADFEHAPPADWRRRHSRDGRQGRYARGVRLRARQTRIRNLVVKIGQGLSRWRSPSWSCLARW